jgi:hypothetical protein
VTPLAKKIEAQVHLFSSRDGAHSGTFDPDSRRSGSNQSKSPCNDTGEKPEADVQQVRFELGDGGIHRLLGWRLPAATL